MENKKKTDYTLSERLAFHRKRAESGEGLEAIFSSGYVFGADIYATYNTADADTKKAIEELIAGAKLDASDKYSDDEINYNDIIARARGVMAGVYDASEYRKATAKRKSVKPHSPNLERKTLVINLFAGPGAGKTTSALELTAELKKRGFDVEYVPEYAKELVYAEDHETLNNQEKVTGEQYARLARLKGKTDVIVTDSPILLGRVYGEGKISDEFADKIVGWHNGFDNYNLEVTRPKTYQQTGRVENREQAVERDKQIKAMLKECGIECREYNEKELATVADEIVDIYEQTYKTAGTDKRRGQAVSSYKPPQAAGNAQGEAANTNVVETVKAEEINNNILSGGRNRNLNSSVVMSGMLCEDVELKTSANGKQYATAKIGVKRVRYGGTEVLDEYNVRLFGKIAEETAMLEQGAYVNIAGRVDKSVYKGKTSFGIMANELEPTMSESNRNCLTLTGFVNNKNLELKTSENGKQYITLALSVKSDNPKAEKKYETYFVNAYDDTAKSLAERFRESDLVTVHGALRPDGYGVSLVATRGEVVRAFEGNKAKSNDAVKNENGKGERV
mgnify:FL=1